MHMIREHLSPQCARLSRLHTQAHAHTLTEGVNTSFQLSEQETGNLQPATHTLPDIRLPMSYLIILTQFAVTVRRLRKV